MTTTSHTGTDLKAGLLGFIIGGLVLLAIMYGIVHLTNQHYAGESPAAAESTH